MKRIAIIGIFLVASLNVLSQGIKFFEGTFKEAQELAKNENKKIFIDFYTSWCMPCKLMAKKYFTLESVGSVYNDKYICLKIDGEKGEGIDLVEKYNVKAYPTLVYASADGNLIIKEEGLKNEEQLLNLAK